MKLSVDLVIEAMYTSPSRFRTQNLLEDPFAISSLSIASISWIITLGGAISAQSSGKSFPRFTWWGIGYQFMLLCFMNILYLYDMVEYYRTFLASAIGIAFLYSTNSANNLVYSTQSQMAAASAGVILLSIINFIWVFYYGADNGSPVNRWIDSFSVKGIRPSAYEITLLKTRRRSQRLNKTYPAGSWVAQTGAASKTEIPDPISRSKSDNLDGLYSSKLPENHISSTALGAFENTALPFTDRTDHSVHEQEHDPHTYMSSTTNGYTDTTMGGTSVLYSEVGDDHFQFRAKALYGYKADESDAYEISFDQGEFLKVSDIEGRWWKAKRANGQVGIIPSNYVQLIDDEFVDM